MTYLIKFTSIDSRSSVKRVLSVVILLLIPVSTREDS